MNLKSAIATLLIISIVGGFLAYSPEEHHFEVVFSGQGFVLQYRQDSNLLNLTSRANIYDFIDNNPGTHLRNICAGLGISIGSVQYHLAQLSENELIESEKESKYKRFFISRKFSELEKRLIAFLQKPNAKRIIKYASLYEGCSHQELARLLGISSQAVTWHVKRLLDENVIESWAVDNSTYYIVTEDTREALTVLGYEF